MSENSASSAEPQQVSHRKALAFMACPPETFQDLASLLFDKHPDADWDLLCFYNPPFAKRPGVSILLPAFLQIPTAVLLWWNCLKHPYSAVYVATSDRATMEFLRPVAILGAILPGCPTFLMDMEGQERIGLGYAFRKTAGLVITCLLLALGVIATRIGLALCKASPAGSTQSMGRRTAVIIPVLPDLSHTFVYREALELKRKHPDWLFIALERGDQTVLHPEASQLMAFTDMVPKPSINRYLATYLKHWILRARRMALLIRTFQPHTGSVSGRGVPAVPDDPLSFLRIRFYYHSAYLIQAFLFADYLARHDVGRIHVYGAQFPAVRALAANRLLGVQFSLSTFVDFDYSTPFHMLREKFEAARFVTVATEFCHRRLGHRFPDLARKFRVMHPCLPESYAQGRTFRSPDGASRLVYIGRFVPIKGLDVLLKACVILKRRKVPFLCRLYGTGELAEHLRKLIHLYGVDQEAALEPPVPNDRIYELMNRDDIFVAPCRCMKGGKSAGIPVALLEAMAAGITVVSTPVSGIPELIEPGKIGYLVRQNDPEGLANILEQLIRNPDMRAAVSEAAQRTVRKKFSLEKSVAQLDTWIHDAGAP